MALAMTSGSRDASPAGSNRLFDALDTILQERLDSIDMTTARSQPLLLAEVREAILMEARGSAMLSRCLRAMWYDVDACVALTMDDHDVARSRRALRDYLERVGVETLQAGEIAAAQSQEANPAPVEDPVSGLVELMLSDRVANTLFRRLSQRAAEPVLADLLERISIHKQRRIRRVAHLVIRRMAERQDDGETTETEVGGSLQRTGWTPASRSESKRNWWNDPDPGDGFLSRPRPPVV